MNSLSRITHIFHPTRLWLIWQPGPGAVGRRYVVAEIVTDGSGAMLRYLNNTSDFAEARAQGFQGYPAFKLAESEHREGVLDVLMKRLPPASRSDFPNYLRNYRLPADHQIPPFALLGYTTAKLPGDGFSLLMDLSTARSPLDLVMELAGSRYQQADEAFWSALQDFSGELTVVAEPGNPVDASAVALFAGGLKIGYINRVYAPHIKSWLEANKVSIRIDRVNGTAERRLVYVFAAIR